MATGKVFDPNDDEAAQRLLEHYSNQLHEMGFDGVRIFVTRRDQVGQCNTREETKVQREIQKEEADDE